MATPFTPQVIRCTTRIAPAGETASKPPEDTAGRSGIEVQADAASRAPRKNLDSFGNRAVPKVTDGLSARVAPLAVDLLPVSRPRRTRTANGRTLWARLVQHGAKRQENEKRPAQGEDGPSDGRHGSAPSTSMPRKRVGWRRDDLRHNPLPLESRRDEILHEPEASLLLVVGGGM